MATINLGRVKGDKGDAASISLGTVSTLSAGSSATATNTGTSGAAIFNFAIPRGDKGETGSTGPANTLTIAGVNTGAAGSSASVSIGGTSPSQTLTFEIPKGDKGIQGIQGIKGDTGTQGPQGIKGDTGLTGPQGVIGLTGETGPQGIQGEIGVTGATGPQPSLVVAESAATAITLADFDNNAVIRCTSATAVTITVPSTLAVGFSCMVIQAGIGQITIAAGAGATLNSFGALVKTAGQHAPASIIRVGAGVYNLSGNLV